MHSNNPINYDIKGTEDWKVKLVLKIFIIIIESVMNLLLTVTFINTRNHIYPEALSDIHKTGLGEQKVTTHQLFTVPMKRRMQVAGKDIKFYYVGDVGLVTFWKMKETFSLILSRKGSSRV